MSREIKFRIWHKKAVWLFTEKEWQPKMMGWDWVKQNFISSIFADEAVIPMQYTGLKDKNGKEIYEGDIVNDTFYHGKCVVYWDDDDCCFTTKSIEDDHRTPTYFGSYLGWEVIGNIYEYPELLEG